MQSKNLHPAAAYSDPQSDTPLERIDDEGFKNEAGLLYKFVDKKNRIIDFIEGTPLSDEERENLKTYSSAASKEFYRNFLDWLFTTYNEDETAFRQNLVSKLQLSRGHKVLVTGCGFGDDLPLILNSVGQTGEIHAQDLSKELLLSASGNNPQDNIFFSFSSATWLPYASNYFDAVLHFGGINLFDSVKKGIAEMERVCKVGGRVVFGDEGISPHLLGTEYAEVAVTNNQLLSYSAPMALLPTNATDIELSYVLGNCYYVIAFSALEGFPYMNLDVQHKGLRGGTARTRYFGQLEGVNPDTRSKLLNWAAKSKKSVHDILEELINKNIDE